MSARIYFLASILVVSAAWGDVNVPSPVRTPEAEWRASVKAAIESGDFAGWRDALAEGLRAELPPVTPAAADAAVPALALAEWMFLDEVLASEGDALAKVASSRDGVEFLTWLLTNREALEDYNGMAAIFRPKKRWNGLDGWRDIWSACSESQSGLWRRVASACAIAFAEPRGHSTARERFDFFRSSHAAKQLVPFFNEALPFELALTVHADGRGNDELEWAQDVTPNEKKNQKDVGGYGHSLIGYRLHNYRGQTVQGPEYYDRKRGDLSTTMEYGGVCGMISHMNSSVANAHGAPAFTVGQPGHCAYVWKSDAKTWSGGNFISGWTETHDSHQMGFWLSRYSANINLVSAAVEAPGFARGQRLRALGLVWREKDGHKAFDSLSAATAANPLDLSVWQDRIEAAQGWATAPEATWRTIAGEITRAFPKFPLAMDDLLGRFDTKQLTAKASEADKVAFATAAARSLVSVSPSEQWDLIYPAWKSWLARQLTILGVPEKHAAAVVAASLPTKKKKPDLKAKGPVATTVWEEIPLDKRPHAEALFSGLLPVVEKNATIFKGVAAAWLALVAEDDAANARAGKFFQEKLAAATALADIEKLAEAILTATRTSADARADIVAGIRKRLAGIKKVDPGQMDSLLGLLAKHDFRDGSKIAEWKGDSFSKGGEQVLEWDISPQAAKAGGEYALLLSFRWTGGAPLALKAVRLMEDGQELNADTGAETADASLKPAVVTVRLPKPKAGAKYLLRATATGGADSSGVVLCRAEPAATFKKEEWATIGGWGGKEIKAASEITEGWHEMEFDACKHLSTAGPVFVLFKYSSYSSPRVMNVRLLVDGREVSSDLHSCNPISGANTMYSLRLASAPKPGSKVTIRALFSQADGWGEVYVKKHASL